MAETWIVNASPIITLAKINHLNLLTDQSSKLIVPDEVAQELAAGPREDPAREAILAGFAERGEALDISPRIAEWGLGSGESAVLSSALRDPDAVAVLDDAAARSCARTLGISVIGTLGVVLRGKVNGFIPSAATVVEQLIAAGLRLDPKIVRKALEGIGETFP